MSGIKYIEFRDVRVGQEVEVTETYVKGPRTRVTTTQGTVEETGYNGDQYRVVIDGLTVQEGKTSVISSVVVTKDVEPQLAEGWYLLRQKNATPMARYVKPDGEALLSPEATIGRSVSSYLDAGYNFERIHTYDPERQVVVAKYELPGGLTNGSDYADRLLKDLEDGAGWGYNLGAYGCVAAVVDALEAQEADK